MTVEEILAALKAILDEAGAEPMTDEQMDRYEELEGQLKTAQRAEGIQKRQAAYETPVRNDAGVHVAAGRQDDTLERAFDHYLRTGRENQDLVELRAQSVGTDSAGGYTVPETLRQKLVERLKAFGGLASVVEEFTTSGGEPMRYPTIDDTANSGVIAAENTAPASGGADLVFGEVTLGAFTYQAPGASNNPLAVSTELLQDSAFDVQALVQRKLGERIGRTQAVDWVTGAGTTEPVGITNATATSGGPTYTATGTAPTYADVIAAIHSLDPAYRDSARWVFNDATWALFESMEDDNGRPLITSSTDSISGATTYSLRGYPVTIDQAFATFTDNTTNVWGAFGDLQQGYVIRRVRDLTLIVDPYTGANQRQVRYTLFARADGTVQDKYAYSLLKNAADA